MGKRSRDKRIKNRRPESEPAPTPGEPKRRFSFRQHWHLLVGAISVLVIAIVVAVVAGISFLPSQQEEIYPPTSPVGHVESYPEEQVSTVPIPDTVQRHIIEHVPLSDGTQRRGVILQYNCVEFSCEPDLVSQLAEIARAYEYVYMAPYPEMDAKIVLTSYRDLLTLDKLNREKIVAFIEGRQGR
jgi:hypothetical protein